MPLHARPVIQALQRQMNVFVGLQLDDREPSFARQRQHIDHRPVRSRKCRNLRIDRLGFQPLVNHADVVHHQRLQPALWMHAEQAVIAAAHRDVAHRATRSADRRNNAQLRSSSTRSSAPTPNTISCLLRNVTASAPMRARANSSPRQRNAISAGDSTATSQFGRTVWIRAIDSANRSSAAVSLVACTSRVATFPRSVQSISTTAS